MSEPVWDAVVVGGGPAGLSAAYWLARYRRQVLVLDDDRPRNEAAWGVHGYPGLEDPAPDELRSRILEQAREAGASHERITASGLTGEKDAYIVQAKDGTSFAARRVLLAYGRQDRVPDVPGLDPLYGESVFHCPDCDGPSVEGLRVGVLGHDRPAAALALYLLTWASATTLLTDGRTPELADEARATLEHHGVAIETRTVTGMEGEDGRLRRVRVNGDSLPLGALFFHWGSDPTAGLGPDLDLDYDEAGNLVVDPRTLETRAPGVYAAGDIIGHPHLAISAAAEGVRAALAIHRSLLPDTFQL